MTFIVSYLVNPGGRVLPPPPPNPGGRLPFPMPGGPNPGGRAGIGGLGGRGLHIGGGGKPGRYVVE
ncbi:MAG: hypothetical protein IJF06_02240 [Bacteroidaceae bacterium]|nr:hypothetical protein [Bacteroidaceae bacterium]